MEKKLGTARSHPGSRSDLFQEQWQLPPTRSVELMGKRNGKGGAQERSDENSFGVKRP